ncbi:hypothetical protein RB599_002238 [Gaeumannomyces hyphopodioides]
MKLFAKRSSGALLDRFCPPNTLLRRSVPALSRMRILTIALAALQLLGAAGSPQDDDRRAPTSTVGERQRWSVTHVPLPPPPAGHDFNHSRTQKLREQTEGLHRGHDFNRTYLTKRPCIWEDSHFWQGCDHFRIDFPVTSKTKLGQDVLLWGKDFAEIRQPLPCSWSTPDRWHEIYVPGLPHRIYIQPGNACTFPYGVGIAKKHKFMWIKYGNLTIHVPKRCRWYVQWKLTRCVIPVRP